MKIEDSKGNRKKLSRKLVREVKTPDNFNFSPKSARRINFKGNSIENRSVRLSKFAKSNNLSQDGSMSASHKNSVPKKDLSIFFKNKQGMQNIFEPDEVPEKSSYSQQKERDKK
jgi:hypothetical protein